MGHPVKSRLRQRNGAKPEKHAAEKYISLIREKMLEFAIRFMVSYFYYKIIFKSKPEFYCLVQNVILRAA